MSKKNRAKIVVTVFLFHQIFCVFSSEASGKTTLVVKAWHDGMEDSLSDEITAFFRQKLSQFSFLYLVDPQKVDAILNYHSDYKAVSEDSRLIEAKKWLGRAQQHYFDFAFSEAISELKKIVPIFETDPELLLKESSLFLNAWLSLGLSYHALGEKEKVRESFEKILSIYPFFNLDPKGFPPSFRRICEQVEAGQNKRGTSKVVIESDPKVVEVALNGMTQGVTPLTLVLPPAEYTLSFVANNYQTQNKKIALRENETLRIKPKLRWMVSSKTTLQTTRRQLEEGIRIADLLKTDKTLFIDANGSQISLRLLDRRFRSSLRPIVFDLKQSDPAFEETLEKMTRLVVAQTEIDLTQKPYAHLDPEGIGDPVLLAHRPKKISKGFLWGGLGALGVGGLIGGIVAASGGNSTPKTGGLALSFK